MGVVGFHMICPALGSAYWLAMSPDAAESSTRLEIDWLKAIAGALAAVASAVLLSTLGAAGTILGAAIGSLVITIGSALFSQGLDRSKRGLTRAQEKAQERARRQVGVADAEVSRAVRAEDTAAREAHLEHPGGANQELEAAITGAEAGVGAGADPVGEPDGVPVGWWARLAGLPWKHIGLVSLVLFVAAIVIITVFELLAGRSVASITGGSSGDGGTTIGNVGGGSNKEKEDRPRDGSSESPSPSGSESPTGEPSQATDTPTATATVTDTPSEAETPSPTAVATEPQGEFPDPVVGETDGASP